MRGRKSEFTEEMADLICERLAEGESLRAICRDDAMPSAVTVFKWLSQNADFAKRYAHAREMQAEAMADQILEIADETAFDTVMGENGPKADNEWIARSRLRVDARKWLAAKMAPKKYGEKVELENKHSGGVSIERIERRIVDPQK